MISWAERRRRIDELLPTLAHILGAAAHSPNELIHLSLLEVAQLEAHRQDIPEELYQLRDSVLSVDDFHSLATLSTSGPFARVELVQSHNQLSGNSNTGKVYVLKTLERRWAFRMRQQQFPRHELAILRLAARSRSPAARVPDVLTAFLSPTAFHVVLSHAPGGDLWGLLERKNAEEGQDGMVIGLEESWVRRWMADLVEVVEWLHAEGWAHRDIKPQNLLLTARGHLLLTDFGSAAPLTHPAPLSSPAPSRPPPTSIARKHSRALVGTPDYIAPEILHNAERVVQDWGFDDSAEEQEKSEEEDQDGEERAYGCEVDWWSVGVTVYELLYGQAPFFAESIAETYDRIVNFETELAFPPDSTVSSAARDLISSLLVDALKRPSSSNLKLQTWFAGTPWARLSSHPGPFQPPPFTPPIVASSFTQAPPSEPQNASVNFNFESAFFSSPGLSILRPSPRSNEQAQTEENEYWAAGVEGDCGGSAEMGMTVMPSSDAFDSSQDAEESPRPRPPPTARATSPWSAPFETPARPGSRVASIGTPATVGGPASSGRRGRRNVSDVEAWKEMQERAWEVGLTARKKRRETGGVGDEVEREDGDEGQGKGSRRSEVEESAPPGVQRDEGLFKLEERQKGVLNELDGLEEKYRSLFALANAA
ncbi:kinase-like domain-containing protein [Leucosporidium creatinivorum]|uniref:Kinase-like domain-containing protein n=1 Tax=Leucosporidium creatinivorum TaxID=106004 RepID=A0A1Y2FXH7_9BASI|nr:kinase-like domain-containing protein [Leucosporidium creatinivorum]